MKTFTAGRFVVDTLTGAQNGRSTVIRQLHANGSAEVVGELHVSFDALPDLEYVLRRAIAAQSERS